VVDDFNQKGTTMAEHDFGILLGLAYDAFVADLNDHLRGAGFDDIGRSFGYVFRLLADDDLTLRELADALEMTSQGAMKIVDEMERTGYVVRIPDAGDGRVKRLHLTDKGRSALRAARRFHRDYERRLARHLGAGVAAQVRMALTYLMEGAGTPTSRPARTHLRPF
jgi:DNA-binding MarR family transcriptional regulator